VEVENDQGLAARERTTNELYTILQFQLQVLPESAEVPFYDGGDGYMYETNLFANGLVEDGWVAITVENAHQLASWKNLERCCDVAWAIQQDAEKSENNMVTQTRGNARAFIRAIVLVDQVIQPEY
jgi:hypothetical protein